MHEKSTADLIVIQIKFNLENKSMPYWGSCKTYWGIFKTVAFPT